MRLKTNNKGVMLISVYVVLLITATLSTALFLRMYQELRLTSRDVAYTKALYEAEKGISYAYFELMNTSYSWGTHEWNNGKTALQPVTDPKKIHNDCQFDAQGYYVPINSTKGNFQVKAFPDPDKPSITIIRSLGRNDQIERVIEYRASKRGIYDFYYYTPYGLNLADLASGNIVNADGGGIHANDSIRFDRQLLVKDCYELSTPKSIYYGEGEQYIRPAYLDDLDGSRDERAAVPTLHRRLGLADNLEGSDKDHLWNDANGGPWGYYNTWTDSQGIQHKDWRWKSWGPNAGANWPPRPYLNTENHFPGDSQDTNKVKVDSSTGKVISSGDIALNKYNVWIKPYKLDENGEELTTKYTEFPSELNEAWSWDKYRDTPPSGEKAPINLSTRGLNENGTETADIVLGGVDDHWALKKIGGSWNVYHSKNPNDLSYFEMLKDPNYWTLLGYSSDAWQANNINPELFDNRYGDDLENMDIKVLNSYYQKNAWKEFLENADVGLSDGLMSIVMDGNSGGEYLESPSLGKAYWRKAKNQGVYIGIPGEAETPPTAGIWGGYEYHYSYYGYKYDASYQNPQIEQAIDAGVTKLNDNPDKIDIAKKVCSIDASSGQRTCLLEIDVKAMDEAKAAPSNGIIYSRVPIRLTNAAVLPQSAGGFTVICEKTITIKGDFNYDRANKDNNPQEKWIKAALVSRMGVATVSDKYTDAQYTPALTHFLNYPYLNIAKVAEDTYDEVTLGTNGIDGKANSWVYRNYLAYDAGGWYAQEGSTQVVWNWKPDGKPDYYTDIPLANQQAIKNKIDQKDNNYRNTFLALGNDPNASTDYIDPVGNDTVHSWGRMIQPADKDYYYNAAISGNRVTTNPWVAENWYGKTRNLKGAFIQLDKRDMSQGGFTAPDNYSWSAWYGWGGSGEFPIPTNRGRSAPGSVSDYIGTYGSSIWNGYDRQFHTAARSPADVLFSSMEPVWQEISVDNF